MLFLWIAANKANVVISLGWRSVLNLLTAIQSVCEIKSYILIRKQETKCGNSVTDINQR